MVANIKEVKGYFRIQLTFILQPARFGIGSATEQDDESELETFHIR